MLLRRAVGQSYTSLRHLHSSLRRQEVAGEGSDRTTVKILNEQTDHLLIDAYNQFSFLLNNNVRVMGPCVILPDAIMHWKIPNPVDLDERAFVLFELIDPKPDVVFFGYGASPELQNKVKIMKPRHFERVPNN